MSRYKTTETVKWTVSIPVVYRTTLGRHDPYDEKRLGFRRRVGRFPGSNHPGLNGPCKSTETTVLWVFGFVYDSPFLVSDGLLFRSSVTWYYTDSNLICTLTLRPEDKPVFSQSSSLVKGSSVRRKNLRSRTFPFFLSFKSRVPCKYSVLWFSLYFSPKKKSKRKYRNREEDDWVWNQFFNSSFFYVDRKGTRSFGFPSKTIFMGFRLKVMNAVITGGTVRRLLQVYMVRNGPPGGSNTRHCGVKRSEFFRITLSSLILTVIISILKLIPY